VMKKKGLYFKALQSHVLRNTSKTFFWKCNHANTYAPRYFSVSSMLRLNIHEYQSQDLMKKEGIPVTRGKIAFSADEAYKAAIDLRSEGIEDFVVKAQVLTGGRGLGGFTSGLKSGVQLCQLPEEVKEISQKMIGYKLITKQTGNEGKRCDKVYITERLFVRKEKYLALLMDRSTYGPIFIGSSTGGTNIETLSAQRPDAIFRIPIDIEAGLTEQNLVSVSEGLGYPGNSSQASQVRDIAKKLYNMFLKYDCTLAEINPLIEDNTSRIVAIDAKLNFDDNAEFRQPEIFNLRDTSQEEEAELIASQIGLNYIKLDGSIGCLVNGAGLAMATMDIISQEGESPANFLDVGGGATEKQVTEAFGILSKDPHVKAILVNIFGGIMRCDIIANGIIHAVKTLNLAIPLVVRLSGTKVEEAKVLLEHSGLRIIAAGSLDEAAQKVCKVARIVTIAKEAQLQVSFELPL